MCATPMNTDRKAKVPVGRLDDETLARLIGSVKTEDLLQDNTLDVAPDSPEVNLFWDQLVGPANTKAQQAWAEKVAIPAIEHDTLKAAEEKEKKIKNPLTEKVDIFKLNTRAAVSLYAKGHVTPKHAHALGVLNGLLRGMKLWIFWAPGIDGPPSMVDK